MTFQGLENRAAARAALFAELQTGVTSAQAFFDHLPPDPAGVSPFVTVESDGVHYEAEPAIYNKFRFVIGAWVERSNAETAEGVSDTLALEIGAAVLGWHKAEFTQPSEMQYFPADIWPGQWRVEFFFIQIEWE